MAIDSNGPALTDRELLVRIDTRLEGVIEEKRDHETRLRQQAESLRLLEEKVNRAITPKQLWAGLLGAVGLASAGIPIVQAVTSK